MLNQSSQENHEGIPLMVETSTQLWQKIAFAHGWSLTSEGGK